MCDKSSPPYEHRKLVKVGSQEPYRDKIKQGRYNWADGELLGWRQRWYCEACGFTFSRLRLLPSK